MDSVPMSWVFIGPDIAELTGPSQQEKKCNPHHTRQHQA